MSKRSIIGIAGNEIANAGEKLYYLPMSYTPLGYIKAVQAVRGLPLIVPMSHPKFAKSYVD